MNNQNWTIHKINKIGKRCWIKESKSDSNIFAKIFEQNNGVRVAIYKKDDDDYIVNDKYADILTAMDEVDKILD